MCVLPSSSRVQIIAISSAGAKSATALVTKKQAHSIRQSVTVRFLIDMTIADFKFLSKGGARTKGAYTHILFAIPVPNILCHTIFLLWANLGKCCIGKNGDCIFCRHCSGSSLLHCNFYHLWFFSNTDWLHCQLGLDFKREI